MVPKSIEVHSGDKEPEPQIGDEFEKATTGEVCKVAACGCYGKGKGWPDIPDKCGAHIVNETGYHYCAWTTTAGWRWDGVLFQADTKKTYLKGKMTPRDLKLLNTTPGACSCANCGGSLRDINMGPRFVHCPKCEP